MCREGGAPPHQFCCNLEYAADDDFELVIACTCTHDHQPLTVELSQEVEIKNVEGNDLCWFGLFEFCTKHLKETPNKKLLQNWNARKRGWGSQNRSTMN